MSKSLAMSIQKILILTVFHRIYQAAMTDKIDEI